MNEKKKLKKGQATVEYLAIRHEVEELITRGYNLKAIHERLQENGKIKMSYPTLHENHNRWKKKRKGATTPVQPMSPPPLSMSVTSAQSAVALPLDMPRVLPSTMPRVSPSAVPKISQGLIYANGDLFAKTANENEEFFERQSQEKI